MTDAPMESNVSRPPSGWSNRILILAVAAILLLTLDPFQFDFGRHLARPLFPFSLGGWGKGVHALDDFLNVLLFVPFGFGLAGKLREWGISRRTTLGLALGAGVLLSYTVEFLQIYIPQRDSGWEDVLTNSFGAFVGAVLYDVIGGTTLLKFSAVERKVGSWLTWRRAALVLVLYAGCWCAISAQLQKESRLSNWTSDSLLVVGDSPFHRFSSAWRGRVFALEVWDHAVSSEFARSLTSQGQTDSLDSTSIVAYKFAGSAPFQDERHFLPELSWVPQAPGSTSADDVFLDGKSWLTSPISVAALVSDLEKTGQFSLRVLCEPADIRGVDARIVSISSASGTANLELRQKDAGLVFWFRTPLSTDRGRMSWAIPDAFAANEMRNILLSFDGTSTNLFVDGKKHSGSYQLGPGAALARFIRHLKTQELEGYRYVFYVLVFFPVGCLVGLAWGTMTAHWLGRLSLLLALILFSVTLEAVLLHVSDRAVSLNNIWLSILLAAGGSLWINADRVAWARSKVRTS